MKTILFAVALLVVCGVANCAENEPSQIQYGFVAGTPAWFKKAVTAAVSSVKTSREFVESKRSIRLGAAWAGTEQDRPVIFRVVHTGAAGFTLAEPSNYEITYNPKGNESKAQTVAALKEVIKAYISETRN